jgi:hypothetical protein
MRPSKQAGRGGQGRGRRRLQVVEAVSGCRRVRGVLAHLKERRRETMDFLRM